MEKRYYASLSELCPLRIGTREAVPSNFVPQLVGHWFADWVIKSGLAPCINRTSSRGDSQSPKE